VILDKPLESIVEADLRSLIDNGVAEGKTIEYKQLLPDNTYDKKKEFLADVSSFANAAGGHLIIGVREESGVPVEICGLQNIDSDDEILRLENMIRDNIEPRIPGLSIHPVSLEPSGVVIVIRVPRSWAQPHVVKFQHHWRFYSRNSAGKYPLDVSELRAAFMLSETTADRIRLFRTERLGKIIAGETPVALEGSARIVLHIVPISAFDPSVRFDVSSLARDKDHVEPIHSSGFYRRHNFDGFLTYSSAFERNLASTYLQVFRNGSIEAVEAALLNPRNGERLLIPGHIYEREVLHGLSRFLSVQKQLGVEPPLFVMLSLLGVYGYVMAVDRIYPPRDYPIDRNDLVIPEVDLGDVMRPAFDAVWNATGWPRSKNYDENGKWAGDQW